MTSLDLAFKARQMVLSNRPARLYRSIIRELPRVMQIYDIVAMGETNLRQHIRKHFYANAHLKDERVIDMVLTKAYIDLEETLLQYKQKNHLMLLLESPVPTHHNLKQLSADSSVDEQFARLS